MYLLYENRYVILVNHRREHARLKVDGSSGISESSKTREEKKKKMRGVLWGTLKWLLP